MIVIMFCFVLSPCICFVVVSVSVYNVFVLCFMFLGSTLVQAVPFGATQSSVTNQNYNYKLRTF